MPGHPSALSADQLSRIALAYDSPPWWYDVRGFFILTFAYRGTLWEQLRLFAGNLGREHLEVAIGSGTLFAMVLKRAGRQQRRPERIVGFDYAEAMLAGAVHRFAPERGIELGLADVGAMPYSAASFDSVNVANAMHCFPDVALALREIHRVLRPGGSLAANVLLEPSGIWPLRSIAQRINRWGMAKGILHRAYRHDEIRQAFRSAGFSIRRDEVSGNAWNVIAVRD